MAYIAHTVQSMLQVCPGASNFIGGAGVTNRTKTSLAYMFASSNAKGRPAGFTFGFDSTFIGEFEGGQVKL